MYGKIFVQIYDGSLYGRWQALVTFQQLIVLADQDGTVDMTVEALAARTSIPIKILKQGIDELEQPDRKSRTPDEEGRRIIRLSDSRDWGWQITNYAHYRAIRTAEERREYFKEHKRKSRAAKKGTAVHQSPPLSTTSPQSPPIVEVEVNAEVEAKLQRESGAKDEIADQLEASLVAEFGGRWTAVAEFLESRRSPRGPWIRELSKLAVDYPPEDIERACADAATLDIPLAGAKGLRKFVASAKTERLEQPSNGQKIGIGGRAFDTAMKATEDM